MTKSALLVIDAQVGLLGGAYREREVLDAINRAIDATRINRGLVVFVQHCHSSFAQLMKGQPGWQIHPQLSRTADDLVIEKTASDAFYDTDLHKSLESAGSAHLLVTGLQTEFCVDTTCRSALSLGYEVTLVSDAHTTGDSHLPAATIVDHHNSILANLAHPNKPIQVRTSTSLYT